MEKKQSNEEYIKTWFLEHNKFLPSRDDKEEMLEWLTLYVITLERYFGLSDDDQIIKEGESFRYVSGIAKENEQITRILKMINYAYGYLDLSDLKKRADWQFNEFYDEGTYDDECIKLTFGIWVERLIDFYKYSEFNRIVYRMDGNVYYADQELTDEEIADIRAIKSSNQVQFNVDHLEDGSMYCW